MHLGRQRCGPGRIQLGLDQGGEPGIEPAQPLVLAGQRLGHSQQADGLQQRGPEDGLRYVRSHSNDPSTLTSDVGT